jgi:lysophospholipase L1-like esterase
MYELFSEVVNTLRGDGLTNIRGPMPIIPLDLATHFDFYTPPHDPIHPNAAGQAKIAADVLAFINGRG